MFDEALAIFTDIGAEVEAVDAMARKAECRVLMGDGERRAGAGRRGVGKTEGSDASGPSSPLLYRTRGYALAQLGRLR